MKGNLVINSFKFLSVVMFVGLGFAIGFLKGADTKSFTPADISIQKERTADRIAIVNMDSGVSINGQKIYYATQFMPLNKDNFVSTNLQDAESGILSGRYAAYIIIPSDFSEGVVSINSIPHKTDIIYALNNNLDEEFSIKAIQDVEEFYQNITNGVSCMYTNSIMSEVHRIQDGSQTVMDNDIRDTTALQSVRALDLTTYVTVPDLTVVDSSTVPIDINSYINNNAEEIEAIKTKYAEWDMLGREDFFSLKLQGDELVEMLEQSECMAKNFHVELSTVSGNDLVYLMEGGEVEKNIDDYEIELEKKEEQLVETLSHYKEEVEAQIEVLDGKIQEYNKILEEDAFKSAEVINNSWVKITSPDFSTEAATIIITDKEHTIMRSITPTLLGETQATNRMHILADYAIELEELLEDKEKADAIKQKIVSNYKYDGDLNSLLNEVRKADTTGVTVDIDSLAQDLQNAIYDINEVRKLSVDEIYIKIELHKFEDAGSIMESMQEIADEITTEINLYNNAQGITQRKYESLIVLPRLSKARMKDAITKDIIAPLYSEEENKKFIEKITEQFNGEIEAVSKYNSMLQDYTPYKYIQEDEVQQFLKGMESNNYALEKDVYKNFNVNMEYVGQVEFATTQNVSSIMDAVQDANNASQKNIEIGLSNAKTLKQQTQESNAALLGDFVTLLPYTRIGSLENTKTYEFIASPANLLNIGEQGRTDKIEYISPETIPDKNITIKFLWILTGLFVLAVFVYIIANIIQAKADVKTND